MVNDDATRALLARSVLGVGVALALARGGYKKGSLNASGAAAAFVVGGLSFASHFTFGTTLILFYYTSSKLTKLQAKRKATLEESHEAAGQRHAGQVLACSALATVAGFWYLAVQFGVGTLPDVGAPRFMKALAAAVLGHYACCAGDTWASEVGVLAPAPPRLVTSLFLRKVPPGTNGGMSLYGTVMSGLGGLCMGLGALGADALGARVGLGPGTGLGIGFSLGLGLGTGLLGSLVDSLLGATLQATYFDKDRKLIVPTSRAGRPGVEHICGADLLSNEAVNAASVLLTTVFSGWLYLYTSA